jgi:tetratricopeptide (TPR) repeat protein
MATPARIDALRRDHEMREAEETARNAILADPADVDLLIALGRVLLAVHREDDAVDTFTQAITIAPDDDRTVAWQVAALSQTYRFDKAITAGAEALARFPDSEQVRVTLGRVYLDASQPDRALDYLDGRETDGWRAHVWRASALGMLRYWDELHAAMRDVPTRFPGEAGVHSRLGWVWWDVERYDEALTSCERAIELEPNCVPALKGRVSALRNLCRYDEAGSRATEAIEKFPGSASLLVERAHVLDAQGHLDEALTDITRALEIIPRHEWALRSRVSFLRSARWFAEAEEAAERAVALRPRDPDMHTTRAWLFSGQDRDNEAVDIVDEALAIDPLDSWALRCRVNFLESAGRLAEAEMAAAKVVEVHPWHPDSHTTAAWVQSDLGHYDEANTMVGQALAIDPRQSRALRSRVAFLRSARRFAEAERVVHQGIDLRIEDLDDLYVDAGWLYLTMGRHDAAVSAVEQALTITPRDRRALQSRVQILQEARRFTEAEEAARQAIEIYPRDDELHASRARILNKLGRTDEALAALDEAVTIAPKNSWSVRIRVDILRDARRFIEAEQAVATALALHPDSVSLHLSAAVLFSAMGRDDEALASTERALAIEPANELALRNRIDILRDTWRHADAERAAREAVEARPQDPDVRTARAWVFSNQGRQDKAVEAVDEALAIDPTDPWALRSRVNFLQYGRRFTEAERTVHKAVELHPDNAGVHLTTALMYSAMGRYDEAVAAADEALRIDPRDSSALRGRVGFLWQARRFAEAEAAAEQAVAAHPRDVDMRTARAWVFSNQEREDEAVAAVEEGLAIDPRDSWALRSRVSFLQYARRFDEAEQAARTVIESNPRDRDSYTTQASLYHATGRDDEAISAIDRVLDIDPTDLWAIRYRIDLLRGRRRFTEAEQAVRDGIQRYPRSAELCVTFARLCEDRDDFEGTLTWFNRARDINPYDITALSGRVSTLLRLRRDSDAELAARDALQRHPADASIQEELGRVQDYRLEFDAALTTFSRALAADPDNEDLILARSKTLRSMRRCREAEREVERLSRKFPHLRDLKVELGWIHHDERRYPQARTVFTALLDSSVSDKERAAAHQGLGWVAFSAGEYARAEDEFRAACRERPEDFDYLLALAWALARQSGEQALREAEEIATGLSARRAEPSVYVCLGVLAYKGGSLATAEYFLKKALDVDKYHGSHTDLGSLYLQMGRYEEAEVELHKAIERDWYDVTSHVELGSLYLHSSQKRPTEAEREFRRALAIDPAAGFAAIGLAQALQEAGDSAEAESALRGALARQDLDQRWRVHLALARLLVQSGEKQQNPDLHAEAYAEAQSAIALAPDAEADPHFVAGVAHHRMGSIAADARGRFGYRRRAMHHLNECLDREPGHVDARRNVQLLEREMKAVAPAVWGGYAVAGISFALLATLWITFFLTDKVTALILTTTTPVLVGLFTIAVLLPALIRLKLPGFEADLQAGASAISPGPTGQVTFGPGRFTVSTGPTGQLPRLE